jgi:hypothetical protein
MPRILLLALLILALVGVASAETRWCDVTGRGAQDAIVYPPIAKAAHVYGLVMGRVIFTPDGKVTGFEPIRGPVMLQDALRRQLSTWTVQTKATGTEACQTLVVADFSFCPTSVPCEDNPACSVETNIQYETSILRVHARAQVSWLCCPGGTLSYGNPIRHAWYSTRRTIRKLFHRNQ